MVHHKWSFNDYLECTTTIGIREEIEKSLNKIYVDPLERKYKDWMWTIHQLFSSVGNAKLENPNIHYLEKITESVRGAIYSYENILQYLTLDRNALKKSVDDVNYYNQVVDLEIINLYRHMGGFNFSNKKNDITENQNYLANRFGVEFIDIKNCISINDIKFMQKLRNTRNRIFEHDYTQKLSVIRLLPGMSTTPYFEAEIPVGEEYKRLIFDYSSDVTKFEKIMCTLIELLLSNYSNANNQS